MARDPQLALDDMMREIKFLAEIERTHTLETFLQDEHASRAASYSIQIISEAARHLPSEWLRSEPTVPWHQVKAIGNRLRHEYFHLSFPVLWNIITTDCKPIRGAVQRMLTRHGAPPAQ